MEKVGHDSTRSGDSWRAGDGVSVVVAGDAAAGSAPTPQATDLEEHEGSSEGCSLDSIDLVNVHQVGKQEPLLGRLPPTTSSRTCKEKPRTMSFHVHPPASSSWAI
jgi:hypothetical protein